LIVDDAQQLVDLLMVVFEAKVHRCYQHENGKIAHIELQLDDSILMISNSTDAYPANKTMLHYYVPNVYETFDKAILNGCELIEKPIQQQGDSDIRCSFYDTAGNYWSVSSQSELIN